MDNALKILIKKIYACQEDMVQKLYDFCEINSGTGNLLGLEQMRHTLKSAFSPLEAEMEVKSLPSVSIVNMDGDIAIQKTGDVLFIRKRPQLARRILLCGHMDTVYSAKHPFQTLTPYPSHQIKGPGVADMKGGLIVMLYALLAFESTPYAKTLGWDIFINADEEIGSPASRILLEQIAPQYQAALVYEPAMTANGDLAKNRKGSGKLTIIATGVAAHTGRAFNEGRNAICYLAEAILSIHALNGQREGVTINVGKISGGQALNMVPAKAVVKLDVRIQQPDDEFWVRDQLALIFQRLKKPDYSLSLHGDFLRPVKQVSESTERLFFKTRELGKTMGIDLNWKDSGGCCDGNNLAAQGVPVLDTLGVRGGLIHSPEEFIILESLPERASLSLLLLADLAKGGLEGLKA